MSDTIELYVNGKLVYSQGVDTPPDLPPKEPPKEDPPAQPPPVTTPPTPPVSPPAQGDGLDAFRARQAVSQNCAWVLTTSVESGALLARLGDVYHAYVQFYTVGGSGSVAPNEVANPASPSGYSYWTVDQQLLPDVGQAADAYVAQRCAEQGIPGAPGAANV